MALPSWSHAVGAAVLTLACGACDIAAPRSTTVWEGRLASGDGSDPLSGTAAAVSGVHTTEATLRIVNALPSTTYDWEFRAGTCEQPGDRVGGAASYPGLETSASGIATATTVLSDVLRSGGTYVAVVIAPAGDNTGMVLACGGLEMR